VTAGILFLFALLFLVANTAFILHETLLVRRYELRIVARRIDEIFNSADKTTIGKKRALVLEGVKFAAKKGNLKFAAFNLKGDPLVFSDDYQEEVLRERNYPTKLGSSKNTEQWKSWNKWDTDIYYTGEYCYVKLNDTQNIEIEDDIILFFLVSLPVIAVLAVIGGGLLGAAATRQIGRVEKAAAEIAGGNLAYRVPTSSSNDEMAVMERDLNRMFAELESSFSRIMEFSSDLAHELRTPLTVMTGELEVALRETRSEEEYQRVLAKTMEEVAFLRRLVDDMLILVKPNLAYAKENFETIDLSELLSASIDALDLLADSKGVKTHSRIPKEMKIHGNPSLVRMLLYNLLHNSIKYSGENGEVEISLTGDSDTTTLSIKDNGPGIPEEERLNVFKRFYRMKIAKDNGSSGTGLGLAIVKKVCEVHEAEITLESSDEGSTFTVVFKLH